MKPVKSLILALCLGTLSAGAQSVSVLRTDGSEYKICTDYVQKITLEEVQAAKEYALTSIESEIYAGCQYLTLKNEAGDAVFYLEIYGEKMSAFVNPGTYEGIEDATKEYSFDTKYSTVKLGGVEHKITAGTVEIKDATEGYSIVAP